MQVEAAAHHLHGLGERRRVGGVARNHPHRHRPALGVAQQPVLDLRLAALAVAGMPERRQLVVAAFHPGAGQVEHGDAALVQVPAGQLGLDLGLAVHQPVHRGIHLVGGRPRHPKIAAQGDVVPPADGGQLGAWADHSRDDQRIGQVPRPAWWPQQVRQAQLAGDGVHRGHVPVAGRALHRQRGGGVDHGPAGQHQAQRRDRLVRQVRQVGQCLLTDLATLAVGAAQQVPLVDPHGPILARLMATGGLDVHRASSTCHGAILACWLLQHKLSSVYISEVSNAISADQPKHQTPEPT